MRYFVAVAASLAFIAASTSAFACSDPNCADADCKDGAKTTQTTPQTPQTPATDPHH